MTDKSIESIEAEQLPRPRGAPKEKDYETDNCEDGVSPRVGPSRPDPVDIRPRGGSGVDGIMSRSPANEMGRQQAASKMKGFAGIATNPKKA